MSANTGNGFRQQALPSRKDQMRQVTTELQNLSMAMRISQMMMQKLATDVERLDRDLAKAMSLLNDLQYRTLATIDVGSFDKNKLNDRADELKLSDFNTASDSDDKAKGLLIADTVEANSTVIVTSEASNDQGIFRSKFKLSETGRPDLQTALLGKKVGDKFSFNLNGVDHVMEVLGVRNDPPKPVTDSVVADQAVEQAQLEVVDTAVSTEQVQ